jgi:hypothetical protein
MFFCEKCRYLYNITKDVKAKQSGGKADELVSNIFDKYSKGEEITLKDVKKLSAADIFESDQFLALNKKEQKKFITAMRNLDSRFGEEESDDEQTHKAGTNIAYFICKFCGNNKPIKPGTLIYSKSYNTNLTSEDENYTYAIYNVTLPRTRNYVCKNAKCETHKDDSLKEAVITKNSLYQVVQICCACSSFWTNAI